MAAPALTKYTIVFVSGGSNGRIETEEMDKSTLDAVMDYINQALAGTAPAFMLVPRGEELDRLNPRYVNLTQLLYYEIKTYKKRLKDGHYVSILQLPTPPAIANEADNGNKFEDSEVGKPETSKEAGADVGGSGGKISAVPSKVQDSGAAEGSEKTEGVSAAVPRVEKPAGMQNVGADIMKIPVRHPEAGAQPFKIVSVKGVSSGNERTDKFGELLF